MILENWQIKVLEGGIIDYQAWIDNVENGQKIKDGKPVGNLFENPDEIIQNKINVCYNRMLKKYSDLDFTGLSEEEKVNLIISQEGYLNRDEREEASIVN